MATEKPPAFQFYVRDFLTGTQTMTLEEVGAYTRCLAYEWDAGGLPDDVTQLARVMICPRAKVKKIWPKIRQKFVRNADGFWRNSRLESERVKQQAFRDRQGALAWRGTRAAGVAVENPVENPVEKLWKTPVEKLWKSASSSSSSSSSASTPPRTPPRAEGGIVVVEEDHARPAPAPVRPPTRAESKWATAWLTQWQRGHWGQRCPHADPCDNEVMCLGRLIEERRHDLATGQRRGTDEAAPNGADGRFTQEEAKWAAEQLMAWQRTHPSETWSCPHVPPCGMDYQCLRRLIEDHRAELARKARQP